MVISAHDALPQTCILRWDTATSRVFLGSTWQRHDCEHVYTHVWNTFMDLPACLVVSTFGSLNSTLWNLWWIYYTHFKLMHQPQKCFNRFNNRCNRICMHVLYNLFLILHSPIQEQSTFHRFMQVLRAIKYEVSSPPVYCICQPIKAHGQVSENARTYIISTSVLCLFFWISLPFI